MFRRVLLVAVVLLACVAATSHASSTTISPCRHVSQPIWSPDGTQIAYYGTRWPPPAKGHRNPNDILQALCTMRADGTNAQPLRYTVCSERCPDPPALTAWLQNGILYLRNGVIYRIVPGSKPQKVARTNSVSIATNPAGTRVAAQKYYDSCLSCAGPLTILDAQSGSVVGKVGGKKLENFDPSLSPDGATVVFSRNQANDSGKPLGLWTANADGSGLRRLVKVGQQPLWSPTDAKIAYVARAGKSVALRLVSSVGGTSRTLVSRNVSAVFGWSRDGRYIAFQRGAGTLAVVDVGTRKVQSLVQLHIGPTASWAPDSKELVVNSVARNYKCWTTWRVPIDGSAPTKISSCTG